MTKFVLDASAVLALINEEPGAEIVQAALNQDVCVMGAVNVSEVAAKLAERGMAAGVARQTIASLVLQVLEFDLELALEAGALRQSTIGLGLSLGDRTCVALAEHLQLPIMTTERAWSRLTVSVPVVIARPE